MLFKACSRYTSRASEIGVARYRQGVMGRCNQCDQELIEIDNYGQRLSGCFGMQSLVDC
jgi:hypothetical protein